MNIVDVIDLKLKSVKTPVELDNTTVAALPKETKRNLIARVIKAKMIKEGWNNNQLADILKKRPSEVSRLLSGTHNFTLDTLFDIEEKLNISFFNLKTIYAQPSLGSVKLKFLVNPNGYCTIGSTCDPQNTYLKNTSREVKDLADPLNSCEEVVTFSKIKANV